jgi:RNA recognition motif-containing protein
MATKLYVGSLAWATTDASLGDYFAQAGTVVSARVVTDRESGRSRGFGFVEMETEEGAQKAIQTLNGTSLDGRSISVSEARPKTDAPHAGGFRR